MQKTRISMADVGSCAVQVTSGTGVVSDLGGLLLLRELGLATALFEQVADCFIDHRDPNRIEHSVKDLVTQRILALCAGYEDLNDHDQLRRDPLFALVAGKADPTGANRKRSRDRGYALAAHATLGRLETAPAQRDPARPDLALLHRPEALEALLVDLFLDEHPTPPDEIVLDVDATDSALHGRQEGRFFHGYYRCYCYLPLYIFCGDHLLVAKLRTSDRDGASGVLDEVQRVVAQIRARWPSVRVRVRGDSGFCRDALLTWCEEVGVDYVIGLAKNAVLKRMIGGELDAVSRRAVSQGVAARQFCTLWYRTKKSWSRRREVVAKAEALPGKLNPRFVVTNARYDSAQQLYEDDYCARAEMENRIKEQKRGVFAGRMSSHTMRANQLRLWFSSLAYVLLAKLRRIGLAGTKLGRAQAWIVREALLRQLCVVRRRGQQWQIALSRTHADPGLFGEVVDKLHAAFPAVF